jgi:hypothetical protein
MMYWLVVAIGAGAAVSQVRFCFHARRLTPSARLSILRFPSRLLQLNPLCAFDGGSQVKPDPVPTGAISFSACSVADPKALCVKT